MTDIDSLNGFELWSDEYFIDYIERKIKHDISMFIFVKHNRHPTKEEYESIFDSWMARVKCVPTDFDLGIFNDGV